MARSLTMRRASGVLHVKIFERPGAADRADLSFGLEQTAKQSIFVRSRATDQDVGALFAHICSSDRFARPGRAVQDFDFPLVRTAAQRSHALGKSDGTVAQDHHMIAGA